ncbi:MAG: hypothetical protein AAFU73_09130 [Planctomycetota bacterium]
MSGPAHALRPGWILGPRADVAIFTGPLVLAGAIVALAWRNGTLHADMPPWMFAALIVACDVAHVWATAFRVYLDPERFKRRPGLFIGIPVACFAVGAVLYGIGSDVFWRALAYLAVWHFVRQQWGWVAYTRARAGEGDVDRRLDQATLYAITLYPVLFWHAHLPRAFQWFVQGDFVHVPAALERGGAVVHWAIVAVFCARQVQRAFGGAGVNVAKLHVLGTTFVAWYGGIVALDSDIAFTAFNVLSHGIPYLAVVWSVERDRAQRHTTPFARFFRPRLAILFLAVLVLVGYAEEWLWDGLVWRDHPGLFPFGPEGPAPEWALALVVPLLAVPQATHYALDGWLWRRAANPDVGEWVARSKRV